MSFSKTGDSLQFVHRGQLHTVPTSHVNYSIILAAVVAGNGDTAVDAIEAAKNVAEYLSDSQTVAVKNGAIVFKKDASTWIAVEPVVEAKILDSLANGDDPRPLVKFVERLYLNPSANSRGMAMKWMTQVGLVINPEGLVLGYKGVTNEYLDVHTRTFNNKVGTTNTENRFLCDDNPDNHCSKGLHVGTKKYADSFGQRTMLVLVDPQDIVAVPNDYNCAKMRCCKYTVVGEIPKNAPVVTQKNYRDVAVDPTTQVIVSIVTATVKTKKIKTPKA